MTDFMITLSEVELLELRDAIRFQADDLDKYVAWINDRPMLPDRELAIARVKDQAASYRKTWLRLTDLEPKP